MKAERHVTLRAAPRDMKDLAAFIRGTREPMVYQLAPAMFSKAGADADTVEAVISLMLRLRENSPVLQPISIEITPEHVKGQCSWCGLTLPSTKKKGRPHKYCHECKRMAEAFRKRRERANHR